MPIGDYITSQGMYTPTSETRYTDGYWTYVLTTVDDELYAIITNYTSTNCYVTVPKTVGGYPVIQLGRGPVQIGFNLTTDQILGEPVFSMGSLITLTIPSCVKVIADRACYSATRGAGSQAYLAFEGAVDYIGSNAFYQCTGLKAITFYSDVPCEYIDSTAFSLGSPASGSAECTIYSPSNWAQDVIDSDIYGTLTFEALDTSRAYNPLPKIRYSYAEGMIPEFHIYSEMEFGEGFLTIKIWDDNGYQELVVDSDTAREMELGDNPIGMSLIGLPIYAESTRTVACSEGIALLSIGEDKRITIVEDMVGSEWNIDCDGNQITVTATLLGTSRTTTLDVPEWCYYPDSTGEYGWYDFMQLGNGLYISDAPICFETIYRPDPSNVYILYQNGYFAMGEDPDPVPVLETTVTNSRLTDAHYTMNGVTVPAGSAIAPLSIVSQAEPPVMKIPMVYDPATRRITLAEGATPYGGATTDVNSVKVVFTGIVPDGTNFKARVDFGVQVKTANHVYNHPFVLLEQDNDAWSAVIPNVILRAAGVHGKLPIQLVVANDDYVINSRNTLTFEVTKAFDGESDGSEIPPYDVPEWEIPEGQVPMDEDIHVVQLVYDPSTRKLDFVDETDKYGGATIDCRSVKLQIEGIVSTGEDIFIPIKGGNNQRGTTSSDGDFSVRADFATQVKTDTGQFVRPFVVLQQVGNVWQGMVPQPILMGARETKKLPLQIVMRHGDTIINSRNAVTLDITRAINAMQSIQEVYGPYIMLRDDTWEWIEDFTYKTGSVVVYDGEMYTSLVDDNRGYVPDENNDKWFMLTGVESVVLNGVAGTRTGTVISFTESDLNTAMKLTYAPRTLDETDCATGTVTYDD